MEVTVASGQKDIYLVTREMPKENKK